MQDEEASEDIEPESQAVQPTAPLVASYSLYFPAGHVEQVDAPPIEYSPAGQATTPVCSVLGLKPAGTDLQEDAPISLLYRPWRQLSQVFFPPSEYSPVRQLSQVLEVPSARLPTPQKVHTPCPSSLTYPSLATQSMQLDAAFPEYFPASQLVQVAALSMLFFPGTQLSQLLAPLSEKLPAKQGEHIGDPAAPNVPGSQLPVHSAALSPLTFPAGQSLQLAAP